MATVSKFKDNELCDPGTQFSQGKANKAESTTGQASMDILVSMVPSKISVRCS